MRPKEVSDKLQLEKIAKDHVWKVEPSCATTGEGIFEGLVRKAPACRLLLFMRTNCLQAWLSNNVKVPAAK